MTNGDQVKTSLGAWVKIFRNNLQGQDGKQLFRKMKSYKNIQNILLLLPRKLPHKFISWDLRKN